MKRISKVIALLLSLVFSLSVATVGASVSAREFGDLNSDGKFNLLDLVAMRKHLAKWDIKVDLKAADTNSDGKVNLIITQKIGNVSRDMQELTICSRLLATQNPPIGIYFISEDIFTLASYYTRDLRDTKFFPSEDWKILPDEEPKGLITDD